MVADMPLVEEETGRRRRHEPRPPREPRTGNRISLGDIAASIAGKLWIVLAIVGAVAGIVLASSAGVADMAGKILIAAGLALGGGLIGKGLSPR